MYKIDIYNKYLEQKPKIRFKFTALIRQFIYAAENGEILTFKKDRYRPSSIRQYKTLLIWIERYETKFGTVFLDQINVMWTDYFSAFLAENDLTKNSISSNIARVKAILNRAHVAGLTPRSGLGIKYSVEKTEQVYLTLPELTKLYHLNLEDTPGKERVRDAFILHCFVGMRIYDFRQFLKDPKKYIIEVEGRNYVNYFSKKTNTKAVIPISATARDVLKKWDFDFGRIFSYQYYNTTLKDLCKEAGIEDKIICRFTKGGVLQEVVKRKYLMVSSHTARRTFASLCELAKISRPAIMKMTGHSSENSFMGYIRISELDSAITIQKHPFFKIKL